MYNGIKTNANVIQNIETSKKKGLKIQYKDKEIRLKALPPTPPRMEGSDMHRLIKRRITSSRRVL